MALIVIADCPISKVQAWTYIVPVHNIYKVLTFSCPSFKTSLFSIRNALSAIIYAGVYFYAMPIILRIEMHPLHILSPSSCTTVISMCCLINSALANHQRRPFTCSRRPERMHCVDCCPHPVIDGMLTNPNTEFYGSECYRHVTHYPWSVMSDPSLI